MTESRRDDTRTKLLPKAEDGFVSASHAILFESEGATCSVCTQPIIEDDEDDEDSEPPSLSSGTAAGFPNPPACRGRGLLVWARGDERRYEEPHLCPSCASAIGVTALQRWEIEEDEG